MQNNRRVLFDYALPKRAYLGPTSMDTEMAFIMCNQAMVGCQRLQAHSSLQTVWSPERPECCMRAGSPDLARGAGEGSGAWSC